MGTGLWVSGKGAVDEFHKVRRTDSAVGIGWYRRRIATVAGAIVISGADEIGSDHNCHLCERVEPGEKKQEGKQPYEKAGLTPERLHSGQPYTHRTDLSILKSIQRDFLELHPRLVR